MPKLIIASGNVRELTRKLIRFGYSPTDICCLTEYEDIKKSLLLDKVVIIPLEQKNTKNIEHSVDFAKLNDINTETYN